jgi:hypothetical protein
MFYNKLENEFLYLLGFLQNLMFFNIKYDSI